MNTYTKVKSAI